MKQSGMMGPVRVMQFWLRFVLPPNYGPCSLTAPLDKDSFVEFSASYPAVRAFGKRFECTNRHFQLSTSRIGLNKKSSKENSSKLSGTKPAHKSCLVVSYYVDPAL